ncbi:hypothetical protein AAFF_G00427130 [Aldrovandia affinis]|uniref:Uncharacterized protein n=1 Tax=Aldrovandia affinis TaxID=143900 RepID=A0AAD7WIV4_9TELE|nr:hypothetical protein AAFF_G00427130 [Aldrovandia affinis]
MNVLADQTMALNVELQQRQTEQEKLLAQRDDISSQLQEVNRANSRLLEQLTELGQEKDKLQQELEETRKTADKRKAMLDELAIDMAEIEAQQRATENSFREEPRADMTSVGGAPSLPYIISLFTLSCNILLNQGVTTSQAPSQIGLTAMRRVGKY